MKCPTCGQPLPEEMEVIAIRVPTELAEIIKRQAETEGRTVSAFVRQLLERVVPKS